MRRIVCRPESAQIVQCTVAMESIVWMSGLNDGCRLHPDLPEVVSKESHNSSTVVILPQEYLWFWWQCLVISVFGHGCDNIDVKRSPVFFRLHRAIHLMMKVSL